MAIKVFDFFSGCGGTSTGFRDAGMEVVLGLDIDPDSAATYRQNFPEAAFLEGDIRNMSPSVIAPLMQNISSPTLFCGCAPCQPFSKQNRNSSKADPRRNLLSEFGRFVEAWLPDFVFVENVPGLQHIKDRNGPLNTFKALLTSLGYDISSSIVSAMSYGVPQTRKRLILLASKHKRVAIPNPSHGTSEQPYTTVYDWIGGLPPIKAGETHPKDPDHQAAKLSAINTLRISVTPTGCGRESWPSELELPCHRDYKGHSDVYGRLAWHRLASGLTTRCISYSNGRFGHPEQNRAISLREAALLQTFPMDYKFFGSLQSRARQVGNAVPPAMANAIGRAVIASLASP